MSLKIIRQIFCHVNNFVYFYIIKEINKKIMKDIFRYFIRKNFTEIGDMTNEEIDQIGVEFHNHLDTKLNDEQKKLVLPKSVVDVLMNSDHPFKTNGFEPAYILHFTQWVKEQSETQPYNV